MAHLLLPSVYIEMPPCCSSHLKLATDKDRMLFFVSGQNVVAVPSISVISDASFAAIQVPGRLKGRDCHNSGALFVHDSANKVFYDLVQVHCCVVMMNWKFLSL